MAKLISYERVDKTSYSTFKKSDNNPRNVTKLPTEGSREFSLMSCCKFACCYLCNKSCCDSDSGSEDIDVEFAKVKYTQVMFETSNALYQVFIKPTVL